MKTARSLLAFLLMGALPFAARAAAPAEEFVLGPGDVVDISVLNHDGLDKTLAVMPDGSLTYPFVGEMRASGKTARALGAEIQAQLEKTRNNVIVTVGVREIHSRQVRVVGTVKKPDAYPLGAGWRLMDLVAAAGGFSTRAEGITGRLIRATEVIPIDAATAQDHPDGESNPPLSAGDTIFFEEKDTSANKVFVVGQVAKPGSYDLTPDMGILKLLSVAGNATDRAALTRATLQRGDREIPVNLYALVMEGRADDDVRSLRLQPGDVLFIPTIDRYFSVMGQVNQPGRFAFPETRPITPVEAISLSGGQTQNGDLKRAGIIRMVAGEASVVPVNVDDMVRRGDLTANTALQPGDVLYVPSREQKSNFWREIISPIAQLGLLGVRLFQ